MRRFASAVLVVLLLAATSGLLNPVPAQAAVGSVLFGVGGSILSVGKGAVCRGLSAAGNVAATGGAVAGGVAGAAASEGAGAPEGAAAGGAVGGVVKKGVGAVAGLLCSSSGSTASGLAKAAVGALGAAATFDVAAHWMIDAAEAVTKDVDSLMTSTTSPQLRAAWFQKSFGPMAALGAALALLVTLIAFTSAALRRDPSALAATLAGALRAGLGTGLLIALTTLGLQVTDAISADVIGTANQSFWAEVPHAWGASGFGGFGSSALAMLMAVLQIVAGLLVWLEMAIRNAAIYLAVLFFPVALAASIWPSLSGWSTRLGRLLFLFIILKPVVLIVLAFAGNAALAGLTLNGGLAPAAGTIIAAVAIFALAALAPWALMLIVGADAESAAVGAGFRAAAGHAVGDGAARARQMGGRVRGSRTRSGGYSGSGGAVRSGGSGGGGKGGGGGSGLRAGPRPSGGGSGGRSSTPNSVHAGGSGSPAGPADTGGSPTGLSPVPSPAGRGGPAVTSGRGAVAFAAGAGLSRSAASRLSPEVSSTPEMAPADAGGQLRTVAKPESETKQKTKRSRRPVATPKTEIA